MALDLILRNARIGSGETATVDIAIAGGRIVDIASGIAADAPAEDIDGRLVVAGFVETHIHLDKSCILDRCKSQQGTLAEAIAEVAAAKRAFSEDDIYQRARRTLEKAILQGTMRMRTHVEVDPRVGLKGFHAIRRLKQDYAWAIDIEICVFPQEGLLNDPGTDELLDRGVRAGRRPDRRLSLYRQRSARPDRAHLRNRAAIRSRHRLSSRFRSRSVVDGSRRSLSATRRPRAGAGA